MARAQGTNKVQDAPPNEVVADVVAVPSQFSKEELSGIGSFDDALRLAGQAYGGVVAAHETEMGDGFRVATKEDKERLIGVPLLLLEWTFRVGDYDGDYVSIRAVAQGEDGRATKWILNDGGTGIATDLREYQEKTGRTGGMFVRHGLRISKYPVDNEDGPTKGKPLTKRQAAEAIVAGRKVGEGYTFYLDTSA